MKNEILAFASKWMELKISVLSHRFRKTKVACFLSYTESRSFLKDTKNRRTLMEKERKQWEGGPSE